MPWVHGSGAWTGRKLILDEGLKRLLRGAGTTRLTFGPVTKVFKGPKVGFIVMGLWNRLSVP